MKVTTPIAQQINELYKTMSLKEVSIIVGLDRTTVSQYIWKPRTRLETLKIKKNKLMKKGEY